MLNILLLLFLFVFIIFLFTQILVQILKSNNINCEFLKILNVNIKKICIETNVLRSHINTMFFSYRS